MFFDGASKGNPGKAGCGAVLYQNNEIIWKGHKYLGIATNNVAEYNGLILGLEQAKEMKINELIIKGDSKLVIEQMKGNYKVKAPHLIPLYKRAKELEPMMVTYEYIPRKENAIADQLANDAIFNGGFL
jgi:ribonuclease HI